jgi:hypothetical protein
MSAHTQITVPIVLVVIGAGALHAAWNAIAKSVEDRLVVFALMGVAATLGGGAVLALTGLPYRAAIGFAVVSAAIHIGYDLGLMSSYRLGAFNQVYPIARGTSPLLVAFGAYFLAGEHLGVVALAGVAILAAGLASLALSSGRLTSSELPAIGAAVLTGVAIAAYTIVDGLGVRRAHDPLAYAGLLFLLQGPVFPVVAAFRRPGLRWLTGPAAARGLRDRALGADPGAAGRGRRDQGDERGVRGADRDEAVRGTLRDPAAGRRGPGRGGHRADQRLRDGQEPPLQRARRMSTLPGPSAAAGRIGVPSSRYRASAARSCPASSEPSAWMTRHHATPPPHNAITRPTWRGPPSPRYSARSP